LHDAASYTSGISWPESEHSYRDPENIAFKIMEAPDSIQFVLDRDMVYSPGKTFNYGAADIALVSEALVNTTGSDNLASYATKGLLKELCINDGYWGSQADGRTIADAGIYLRPRDMVKLGQLVLDQGKWRGKQLVDKVWLNEATTTQMKLDFSSQTYGYYWWLTDYSFNGTSIDTISAWGYGGQFITIVPSLELVVVMTAENYDIGMDLLHEVMRLHVFPEFLG
jgi:CubicO group peptidase (beta-lactamase class C family)